MTARPLAPEADLAHVLDLAKVALQTGTMIDPETLLCDLLGLDEAALADHLNGTDLSDYRPPKEPDQSRPDSARVREAQASVAALGPAGAPAWRQAEAGTVQHLILWGRALCAADDAGPWRTVAGAPRCAACVELEEVLGRHG